MPYVDWSGLYLRALRNISAGEEITCNYLTTEWERYERFICHCGDVHCCGEVKGLKYLDHDEQKKLLPYLPECLKRKGPRSRLGRRSTHPDIITEAAMRGACWRATRKTAWTHGTV